MAQSQEALGESNILGNLLNTGYGQALTQAGNLANTRQQLGEGAASSLASMYGNAGSALAGYGQTDLSNALTTGAPLPQQYLQNLLGIGGLQQSQQQAGLNAQMGQYYAGQQQPIQNLDLLLSAVSGVPYGTTGQTTGTGQTSGTTTGTTTPSTVDQIGSYLGLISKVASIGGAAAGI
jgi:hypothetical protein